jgi:cytoskeletal protein RodZ
LRSVSDAALTVGQTVARDRAAAGMTVAQVAASTRIRATVVSAIEDDDFRLCGGDVYARGHLKSIAAAVGSDPAALVAHFDEQHAATARVPSGEVEPIVQPTRVMEAGAPGAGLAALAGTLGASLSGGRRGPNWSAVMGLAIAVIVAVSAFSLLTNHATSSTLAGSPTSTPSGAAPSSARPTPSTPSTTTTPSTSPTDVVAQADGVNVRLTVTGRASWVRATAAGRTLFEGTLTTGQTKTFKDTKKVKLIIGNAGAVALKVNGRDLGAPGSVGQVVNVSFVPGDPTTQAG